MTCDHAKTLLVPLLQKWKWPYLYLGMSETERWRWNTYYTLALLLERVSHDAPPCHTQRESS